MYVCLVGFAVTILLAETGALCSILLSALRCSLFCAYSLLLTMCNNTVILPSHVLKVIDEEALQVGFFVVGSGKTTVRYVFRPEEKMDYAKEKLFFYFFAFLELLMITVWRRSQCYLRQL